MLRPLSAATLAAGLALLPIRPAVAAPGATGNFKLTYNVYAHGLRAMQMVAQLRLTPSGYSIVLSYHTSGIANMINRSEVVSQATGRFDGARRRDLDLSVAGEEGRAGRTERRATRHGPGAGDGRRLSPDHARRPRRPLYDPP